MQPVARTPQLRSAYKWWVVGMLWFVCFFNYADRQCVFAVFPELEREFHFNKEQLGLIGSAFMWVYAAGALFAGLICCLLYTSDAADERSSVDLGGRRIIKKKKNK